MLAEKARRRCGLFHGCDSIPRPGAAPVGAGLPAIAVCLLVLMLDVPPSSRASSAPTGFCAWRRASVRGRSRVGAGLLAIAVYLSHRYWMCRRHREQARSHRVLCLAQSLGAQQIQGGSEPARDSGGSVGVDVGCAAAFASGLAPTEGCSGYREGGQRWRCHPANNPGSSVRLRISASGAWSAFQGLPAGLNHTARRPACWAPAMSSPG